MATGNGRFMFAGHATGASARFHRLDELQNLDHVVPTLGASVVPVSGGRTESNVESAYRYDVNAPRNRCLLGVQRVYTLAEGRDAGGIIETEVSAEVYGLEVVEKLRCDFIRMHMLASRTTAELPAISTKGNRIEGLRLGNVEAIVTLDEEPLGNSSTADQFAAWHNSAPRVLDRFGEYWRGTIVREIRLVGSEIDKQGMSVDGNMIVWNGFGRIILGEIHVKAHERRLTLVRLEMGSDAGGTATTADGQTNGSTGN